MSSNDVVAGAGSFADGSRAAARRVSGLEVICNERTKSSYRSDMDARMADRLLRPTTTSPHPSLHT